MIADTSLDSLDPQQLHQAVRDLQELVARQTREATHKQAIIDKLTHENAVLKRLKFAAQSERFDAARRSLLEETLDANLQAVSDEIERLVPQDKPAGEKNRPKRHRCPRNCRGARSTTNPRTPPAAAAANEAHWRRCL